MNEQSFSLQPFASTESLPNLQITGNIARHVNQLAIRYLLTGNLKEIIIDPPANIPLRKHELWQNTCFEFFIGINNSPEYWEFNLSPSGHWNIYYFDRYRQGMQEETAFQILPFSVQKQSEQLALALHVDLDKIVSANQGLEVAITAVIKHKNSEVNYWALTHQGAEADFHLRDSFIIQL